MTADRSPLTTILAKSAKPGRAAELLTTHSSAVRDAARVVAGRIGPAGLLTHYPDFWVWAEQAGLLHDAGKTAERFQRQVRPSGERWGERHEVLSLGYVEALYGGAPPITRLMVASGVAFHHRPLRPGSNTNTGTRTLAAYLTSECDWERTFGYDADAPVGERAQVRPAVYRAFVDWYAAELDVDPPEPDGRKLWERARDRFVELASHWEDVEPDAGLMAILLQGAVTLADRSASAGVALQRHMPLPLDYLDRMAHHPYPHQTAAGDHGMPGGHVIVRAPTGRGKTETGLAWAARQLHDLPGEPRLVWTLPYQASINAMWRRFGRTLDPDPDLDSAIDPDTGSPMADIGILHGRIAHAYLSRACDDERHVPGKADADRAAAEANAARLFRQRVRVSTPYQLLRSALGGPSASSLLLEQANCLVVFDELHAYDPTTFGRLCATMRLWRILGSRIAVLSATLAPQLGELIEESIGEPIRQVTAEPGTAPDRHRLVVDDEPIDAPESIERIEGWLVDGHSVLVTVNTVRMAQQLSDALAPTARRVHPDDRDAAILLHARFKGRDRSAIERRMLARHAERSTRPNEPRNGGLVVATQTVEVSLCLYFDRGASQVAPIESVVQRMGRVNRLGRHPEGRVEFRVHATDSPLPYRQQEIEVAWNILTGHSDEALSEESLNRWLTAAYDSEWGRAWLKTARVERDRFAEAFFDFSDPYDDRSGFADQLDQAFDTVEVLLASDLDEFEELTAPGTGHRLLAADLLIPLRYSQVAQLTSAGLCALDRQRRLPIVNRVPYDPESGLDLAAMPASPGLDTVL